MVLYKRKQVTFVKPQRIPEDLSVEVYYIPESKEWFYEYEEYLKRIDYYSRRKFVCEITGNSCLTFCEALKSEEREIKGVEKNFPEALREHILRFLQFNRITRLDQLVDKVYSVFKNDYFPGENIYIKGAIGESAAQQSDSQSNAKSRGVVREKVQYGSSDSFTTKYLVVRLSDNQQAIVTGEKISRDRNHFTKWLIKTFIKLTMSRSHKIGAPWVVKDKFAKKYRIPQEYPDDLKQFESSTPIGDVLYEDYEQGTLTGSVDASSSSGKRKNATSSKSSKKKVSLSSIIETTEENGLGDSDVSKMDNGESKSNKQNTKVVDPRKRFPLHHVPEKLHKELEKGESSRTNNSNIVNQDSSYFASIQPTKKNIVSDLELSFNIQHSKPKPEVTILPENASSWNKKIIENLKEDRDDEDEDEDADEKRDRGGTSDRGREEIETNSSSKQYLSLNGSASEQEGDDISKETERLSNPTLYAIQEALQVWTFLNVYGPALKLDNFTFDDFVYAMGWNLDQFESMGRCELLDEIWCAVLGAIISNEIPNKDQEAKAEANDTIFGLLVNLPPKNSFLRSDDVKGENYDTDGEDLEERGSDSENEEKTLKSEEDESEGDSSSDVEGDSKRSKGQIGKDQTKVNGSGRKLKEEYNSKIKKEEDNEADNEVDDEEEDEEDEEEEDSEANSDTDLKSDVHNAYIVMNHRNTTWIERLRRRNFKDGNWQCILLGVLSLIEHVPEYKDMIEKVYETLAPSDSSATPSTVLNQFYASLDINTKFQILDIIVSSLVNGSVVRNYIDYCLETSANLRRNRLDNIRDYKIALEECHKHNQFIHDAVLTFSGKEPADSSKRARLIFEPTEMSEYEKKIAQSNPEFISSWNKRSELLLRIDKLKKAKKEIEKKLTELDCQRVKYLGKDRFFNRYWWFENNGLPVNGGVSSDDDIDEDEADREKNLDEDDMDKDDDTNSNYFMGRLWVQGPSNTDLEIYYDFPSESANVFRSGPHIDKDEISSQHDYSFPSSISDDFVLKDMDFTNLSKDFTDWCSKNLGLVFKEREIKRSIGNGQSEELVIDSNGGLVVPSSTISSLQRKVIEEQPVVLLKGSDWRYYDKPHQILGLIQWLNPWGSRESQLRKELLNVKDTLIHSLSTRRKLLNLDKLPEDELQIKENIKIAESKLESLGSDRNQSPDEKVSGYDVVEGSKRSLRNISGSRKRRKVVIPFTETIEHGSSDDLRSLLHTLSNDLTEKQRNSTITRVMTWTNQKIRDESDKSLYEGGDKPKSRAGRKPRK